MGMIASATGLGGLIIPYIVQGIIETLGGPWYIQYNHAREMMCYKRELQMIGCFAYWV